MKLLRAILSVMGGIILTVVALGILIAGAIFSVSLGAILVPIGLVVFIACALYFETEKPDS